MTTTDNPDPDTQDQSVTLDRTATGGVGQPTPSTDPTRRRQRLDAPALPIRVVKGIVLLVICAVVIIPFIGIVSTSIASAQHVTASGGFVLWPDTIDLAAYKSILAGGVVTRALLISVGVTVVDLRQPGRLDPAGLRAQSTRIVRSRADADDRPADPAVRARAHPGLPGGQGAWSTGLAVVADRADGDQRVQRDRAAGVLPGHPARADRQRPDRRRRRPQRVPAVRAAVVEGGARGDWAVLRRRVLERVLQRPALPDVGYHPAPTSLGRQEVDGQHVRTIAALISPGGGRPRRDQGPRAAFVRVAARRPPNRPVRGTVHRSWPATPHWPRSAFAASSPVVAARSINATG